MLYSPFSSRTGDTLCNIKDVLFEYIHRILNQTLKKLLFSRMLDISLSESWELTNCVIMKLIRYI